VLLGAAVLTALIGDWLDTGVILAVVVLNALIGFIQEGKAEKAVNAIRQMLSLRASVLRDGRRREIPADLPGRHDLVDTPAIHVDHLEAPAVPGKMVARFGDATELRQHEPGQGVIVSAFLQCAQSEGVGSHVDGQVAVQQPGAVLPLYCLVALLLAVLGDAADDGGEDVGGGDDPLHRAVLVHHDGHVDR